MGKSSTGNRGVIALGHPVAVISLFGLVINDHLLKAEFGNWLTGKLSDVFGLVVFPLLLAAMFERFVSRPMRCAAVCTGGFFVLIKGVPAVAVVVASGLSVLTPSRIVADPTDLIALPAIGIAWLVWARVDPEDQRGWKLPVGRILLAAGVMASLATSVDEGYSETFTGSFVLTAEEPSAQLLVETFIDGKRVSSAKMLEPRWEASFLGPLIGSFDEAIAVEVVDRSDGPDVVTFTLATGRSAPAEVHWSIVARGNEGSPGVFGGRETEDATLIVKEAPENEEFSLDLLAFQPLNQNRTIKVNEWSITVDSNSAELSLASLTTTAGRDLRAATEEQLLDIAPGGSVDVPLPTACAPSGCSFRLFTVTVGEGRWRDFGPPDLRLFAHKGTATASIAARPLKKRTVTLDAAEVSVRDGSAEYGLGLVVAAPQTPVEQITAFLRTRTTYERKEESSEQSPPTVTTVTTEWEYHPTTGPVEAQVFIDLWGENDVLTFKATAQYLALETPDPEALQVKLLE